MKYVLILLLLLLAGGCILWHMRYVAREDVEQTELILPLKICPGNGEREEGGEIRLAVWADVHARPDDGAYLDRLVRQTLALRPDAILLLGDYPNGHEPAQAMPLEELAQHLRPLTQMPCYAILGNHDYYHGHERVREMLERLGVVIVEGKRVECRAKGKILDIGGIRCLYTFKEPGTVPQPRDGVPLLLLSHSPMGAAHAANGTALVLSGHTHGGQICWPTGRPVYMADGKTPAAYAAGKVTVDGHPCYVSRGLGTSLLPLRLFCNPELLLIRIVESSPAP